MFTKQNSKFINTLCLQNKTESLQPRYVYKTKQKVNKHVIFTKQNRKLTNMLYLQNKTNQKVHRQVIFYKTESVQTRYVYKAKQYVYKHVTFTKQNSLQTRYVYVKDGRGAGGNRQQSLLYMKNKTRPCPQPGMSGTHFLAHQLEQHTK